MFVKCLVSKWCYQVLVTEQYAATVEKFLKNSSKFFKIPQFLKAENKEYKMYLTVTISIHNTDFTPFKTCTSANPYLLLVKSGWIHK